VARVFGKEQAFVSRSGVGNRFWKRRWREPPVLYFCLGSLVDAVTFKINMVSSPVLLFGEHFVQFARPNKSSDIICCVGEFIGTWEAAVFLAGE
jgi:hypothetical protein